MNTPGTVAAMVAATLIGPLIGHPARASGLVERASVASSGAQGAGGAVYAAISASGRYVAFQSWAANLVDGDTNGWQDVFVHDRSTGATERVSVGTGGSEADGWSGCPSISADGRYVAFESYASNLAPGMVSGWGAIYVRDRLTGVTACLSVGRTGEPDGDSAAPAISADGRWVAFESAATNLIASDTNAVADVFVCETATGAIERVSLASGGAEADLLSACASISADGRYVAFQSIATNLAAGCTGANSGIFVRDRQTGITEHVSVSTGGEGANDWAGYPSITGDGRCVAFASSASNLLAGRDSGDFTSQVYVRDRSTGATECVSTTPAGAPGNRDSSYPSISATGRFVAFESAASDIAGAHASVMVDCYLRDRAAGRTDCVTVGPSGTSGNDDSFEPVVSADGIVAFQTNASDLVDGDTNTWSDVMVRVRPRAESTITAQASGGAIGRTGTLSATLVGDGSPVVGASVAFTIDGVAVGFAGTDASGAASLPVTIAEGAGAGVRQVRATFAGSATLLECAGAASLTVSRGTFGYSMYAVTGAPGQRVSIRSLMMGSGIPIVGRTVRFAVDGADIGQAVSDATGVALAWTVPADAAIGTHNITLTFDGDAAYEPAARTCPLLTVTVPKANVGFSMFASAGTQGQPVVLHTLMLCGSVPVVGRTVQFAVDGTVIGQAVSDASGASRTWTVPAAATIGTHSVTVSFAGDSAYNAASRTSAVLTVAAPRANVGFSLYAATGAPGQAVALRTLMLSGGAAVIGRTVQFAVDGTAVGHAVSDAAGASLTWTIPASMTTGAHSVTASFVGDTLYNPASRTTAALAVLVPKASVGLSLYAASGSPGQTVTLRSLVLSGGAAVSGLVLQFAVDGADAGQAISDAAGASLAWTIPADMAAGVHSVTVTFAGDAAYNPTARTSAVLTVK